VMKDDTIKKSSQDSIGYQISTQVKKEKQI
jgi:hypothetical protein